MVKGHRPERPPRPRDPVVVVDPPPDEPCGKARTVRFVPELGAEPGTHVDLVPSGDSLWLIAGPGRVGRLLLEDVPEVRDCVADGWAFDGEIEVVATGLATAIIRGHPTR